MHCQRIFKTVTLITFAAMEKDKPVRLLFLDMMRFIALFMMIQGHTIYALLDKEIRDGNSWGIGIWTLLRGYTAPFFMVIAGAVFTYLLLQQDRRLVSGNMRIRKGLIRVGTLLFWGYMLRFQIETLFKTISQSLLENMIAVDVLHIIGLGLLTVIGVFVLTRKNLGILSFSFLALFFVVAYSSPFISQRYLHNEPEDFLSYDRLGIQVTQNTDEFADSLHIFENDGVLVLAVRPGSIAEQIGFQKHDVIVKMGWEELCHFEDIPLVESRQRKGEFADFDVVRGMNRVALPFNFTESLRPFPKFFTFWVNSVKTKTQKSSPFPIFPWLSYILFGAFFGALLAWMKDKGTLFRLLEIKLLVLGGALIALSIFGDKLEVYLYGKSNFWGDVEGMGASANLVFHRIGVVILVGAVCAFLARFITRLPKIMNQMSRNTLWLYVGHLIVLYWIIPPIFDSYKVPLDERRFDLSATLFFVIMMYALMITQTLIIEKKSQIGSWKGYFSFVRAKFKR
jgi:uncharacterized membrane protein